jgi:hypothetical protein
VTFSSTPAVPSVVGGTYVPQAVATPSGNGVFYSIDATSATICTISAQVVTYNVVGVCAINAVTNADNAFVSFLLQFSHIQQTNKQNKGFRVSPAANQRDARISDGLLLHLCSHRSSCGWNVVRRDCQFFCFCSLCLLRHRFVHCQRLFYFWNEHGFVSASRILYHQPQPDWKSQLVSRCSDPTDVCGFAAIRQLSLLPAPQQAPLPADPLITLLPTPRPCFPCLLPSPAHAPFLSAL